VDNSGDRWTWFVFGVKLPSLGSSRKPKVDALAQDVEPAQTVVDKAHNHRDDYDCDYPADESVDES